MGRKHQRWEDIIGSLPYRLHKIYENVGGPVFNTTYHNRKSISRRHNDGKFTATAFARWIKEDDVHIAQIILRRMRDKGGWVGSYISKFRDEKNGQIRYRNIYYLSPRAIKYRNEQGDIGFLNKEGWLYKRFLKINPDDYVIVEKKWVLKKTVEKTRRIEYE